MPLFLQDGQIWVHKNVVGNITNEVDSTNKNFVSGRGL